MSQDLCICLKDIWSMVKVYIVYLKEDHMSHDMCICLKDMWSMEHDKAICGAWSMEHGAWQSNVWSMVNFLCMLSAWHTNQIWFENNVSKIVSTIGFFSGWRPIRLIRFHWSRKSSYISNFGETIWKLCFKYCANYWLLLDMRSKKTHKISFVEIKFIYV